MSIPDADFKSWNTSGNATGSDGGAAQNNPDDSRGGWRSNSEMSLTIGNLFEIYTQAQLTASTRYRCIALTNANVTGVRAAAKMIVESLSALKSGLTVTFGMMTNDTSTVAPVCTDTTAPAGITFFTPFQSTGNDTSDYEQATARPLGPLNTDSDGSTLIDFDDDKVIFLYIKIVASGASGGFTDGVDNEITPRSLGTDSI